MFSAQYRKRLEALFADIEILAAQPSAKSEEILRELDVIRSRLEKLEAEFRESDLRQAAPPEPAQPETPPAAIPVEHQTAQLIYELEQLGYAYCGDQLEKIQNSNIPTPPGGQVITTPFTTGGQVIGGIQIEPSSERAWSEEDESMAEAIARQVSQQIQNLRLLDAAERARADAEASTRRFIHESWDNFLDGIHEDERIGYAYNQSEVAPYLATPPEGTGFDETVKVMDEQVGSLHLVPDPNRPLNDDDKALISAVANQIAQQVENIRLVADASRARAEAEEASRLLTRDNWQAYMEQANEDTLGFIYDTVQVRPLDADVQMQKFILAQPLTVRGEAIGQLSVAGLENLPPQAAELAASIAAQASIHLETLRLTDELRKRAAELQELDRLKSAFLANMSHELRTPLNSILGFADVMLEGLDGPLTDYMNNDLQLIQKNGQHLLHLINDVLDMAKITAGRMNLVIEKFQLYEVLDEITSVTAHLASDKSVSLFIEPDSDQDVEVAADRTRLHQVMLNLINNSIKFTEKGKISIRTTRQEEDVLICVKDTGIGIPPEQLEMIFQEFVQVDTSTTRKVGGTGLGLPISRRLIEMHGGRLWAESSGVDGEGSTFNVLLPLEAKLAEEDKN